MPYYHTQTEEFGVSLTELRRRYPLISLPEGIKQFDKWSWYQETPKPVREYSSVREIRPVDNEQKWELIWNYTAQEFEDLLRKKIDDLCANVMHYHERFGREYVQRETEAFQYRERNYEGIPGKFLKGFADKAQMDYRTATDLVLAQSVLLRGVFEAVTDARMRKYEIRNQTSNDVMYQTYKAIEADILKQYDKLK